MTNGTPSLISLAIPMLMLAALSLGLAERLGGFDGVPAEATLFEPETTHIAPRTFSYRADGEYFKGSMVIDAPMVELRDHRTLTVMKYQVTAGEYGRCVLDGACAKPESNVASPDVPVTGVSFDDAVAYADWLSLKTGEVWRLPSDAEMAFAAGTAFPDDALGLDPENKNPALRWIADYEREAAERSGRDATPRPAGSFGINEYGLADFAGNVWEWTSTCHRRVKNIGGRETVEPICGVYVTVGPHRSPMSSFIKDPKGGGCAVGTPPSNLGFRLVRDERLLARPLARLGL